MKNVFEKGVSIIITIWFVFGIIISGIENTKLLLYCFIVWIILVPVFYVIVNLFFNKKRG